MRSRRCDAAEMCEMKRLWRVGAARNAMFFHNSFVMFCGFAGSESQLLKMGGCGGSAAQDDCRENLHHAVAREQFGSQNR